MRKGLVDSELIQMMKLQEIEMLNQLIRKTTELDELRTAISQCKRHGDESSYKEQYFELLSAYESLTEDSKLQIDFSDKKSGTENMPNVNTKK